jgi:UDP-N-acetylglucosamine 3-dehydrogenase
MKSPRTWAATWFATDRAVNVLLIGLGRWGEKHLRVLCELGTDVWAADVSTARLSWAIGHGVPAERTTTDYRTVLERVDAVDVVTPADSHLAVATTCLAAGRPCLIEKPMTVNVDEGRRLVAAASAARRIVQVGHIFRFHPVTATLHAALAEGRIGSVRYATGRFAGFKRPRTDVGVFHTDGIHYVDLFAYLLGREATTVAALQRDFLGRGLDDLSVVTVSFGDVPVTIEANYFVPGAHRDCVIVGDRGSLVADYGAGSVTLLAGEHVRKGDAWDAVDRGKEELSVAVGEPLRLELAAFLDACRANTRPLVDARAGLHGVEVVEAAARAARLGRTVSIAEIRAA